jgi:ATP-dependent Clp protease protease subunit
MSLRKLPAITGIERPQNFQWDAPSDVLAKWAERPLAADDVGDDTITMFDVIGEDFWTGGGVTAKRISGALRAIGKRDVTVKINSPGGDMFEGIAIYNLLREHPARVTVEVVGWAASAASIIAMAGDEIRMGLGSFMMIHNAWGCVCGNRHDMRDAATLFDGFDGALADIYVARTGVERDEVVALMDGETFMGATDAVERGFADTVDNGLTADELEPDARASVHGKRRLDAALARSGMPRSERRRLMNESLSGTHDAAPPATHDAGPSAAALQQLIETIRNS